MRLRNLPVDNVQAYLHSKQVLNEPGPLETTLSLQKGPAVFMAEDCAESTTPQLSTSTARNTILTNPTRPPTCEPRNSSMQISLPLFQINETNHISMWSAARLRLSLVPTSERKRDRCSWTWIVSIPSMEASCMHVLLLSRNSRASLMSRN